MAMLTGALATVPPTTDEEFCTVSWSTVHLGVCGAPLTVSGNTFSTVSPISNLLLPMYSEGGIVMVTMPFMLVSFVDVTVSSDRCFVGAPGPGAASWSYAAGWEEDGELTAWIEQGAAMGVTLIDLDMTLCDLLCGGSCLLDTSACANPPASLPDGSGYHGWLVEASIGAGVTAID